MEHKALLRRVQCLKYLFFLTISYNIYMHIELYTLDCGCYSWQIFSPWMYLQIHENTTETGLSKHFKKPSYEISDLSHSETEKQLIYIVNLFK